MITCNKCKAPMETRGIQEVKCPGDIVLTAFAADANDNWTPMEDMGVDYCLICTIQWMRDLLMKKQAMMERNAKKAAELQKLTDEGVAPNKATK